MAKISNNNIANAIYIGMKNREGQDLDLFIQNIIKFLVRKKVISKYKDIISKLQNLIDKENGLLKVKITSTEALSDSTKKELENVLLARYKAKSLIFNENIDNSLIGGLKIEIQNEIIDLSISNKLQKLQAHLIK